MSAYTIPYVLPSITSIILIVSILGLYIFYYLRKTYTYWERRGVPYLKPTLFFGNIKDSVLQRVSAGLDFSRMYKELDGHKFGGIYQFTEPIIMIRDPELLRTVLVKNFSNFQNRVEIVLDEKIEPFQSHLVLLSGQRWRNIRYKLTPTFTSGKLRQMENLIAECTRELDEYLSKATSGNAKTGGVLDVKELTSKFAIDVIGTCAFGFRCNSIRDNNSEFRRIARLLSAPSYRRHVRNMLRIIHPRLVDLFKINTVNPEVEEFFRSVLKQSVEHRKTSAQKKHDFLQLLIEIQEDEKAHIQSTNEKKNDHKQNDATHQTDHQHNRLLFTDDVVVSNAFVFFGAGFTTVSYALSFCLYELALNPEICEKMKDEVEMVKHAHNGNLGYEAKKKLTYVDTVISETLRKYPVGLHLLRKCTETFKIPDSSVVIEKGMTIVVSVHGLHHDPKYFPEPEKFLPERFSEENIGSIVPGTYMPFGDGPRMCIAMRFALYEMKSALVSLVSNYTFHPCEKTAVPLKFNSRDILLSSSEGIWVRLQKRQKS